MTRAEELREKAALMRRAARVTTHGDRTIDSDLMTLAEQLESAARDEEAHQRGPHRFTTLQNYERSARSARRRKA